MALNTIIRRSASYVVPLANRFIASKTHKCSALLPSLNHTHLSPSPKVLHYSSSPKRPSSDDKLIRVIQSEIQCAKDSDDLDAAEEVPDGFSFKIQDNPGQQTITLTRDYQGETINVEVFMPDLLTGEDEDDNDNDEDDTDKDTPTHIPLTVSVSKKGGPCLEFNCHAYRDEITIDSLFVKDQQNSQDRISYEGPDFSDLDESLQKALHKYLEIRGINTTTTTYLHDYMLNKDGREYVVWLNNLKQFVEA